MQILGENPQIKIEDHSHAFAFRLGRAEYAVFADWDNGKLCREVGVEEGTRRPRTTDIDQDDALNEMLILWRACSHRFGSTTAIDQRAA